MHDAAHGVEDDVARPSEERPDLRSVAPVVGAVVMGSQGRLIAPDAEQHELAGVVTGENAEVDAPRLGVAGVGQLGEQRAQLRDEANTTMDVRHEQYSTWHRELRV